MFLYKNIWSKGVWLWVQSYRKYHKTTDLLFSRSMQILIVAFLYYFELVTIYDKTFLLFIQVIWLYENEIKAWCSFFKINWNWYRWIQRYSWDPWWVKCKLNFKLVISLLYRLIFCFCFNDIYILYVILLYDWYVYATNDFFHVFFP